MPADHVVPQAAEALAADGAELLLSGVRGLVAAQVGSLREAPPAGGAAERARLLVHQRVSRQVGGVVEGLAADLAHKGLAEVRHPVRLQRADAGVALPTDVAAAALLAGVARLDVQVAVRLVVEALGAEAAGERQEAVLLHLVFPELQDAAERRAAHRAQRVGFPVVVGQPIDAGEQPAAAPALQVKLLARRGRRPPPPTAFGRAVRWRWGPGVVMVIGRRGGRGEAHLQLLTCEIRGAASAVTWNTDTVHLMSSRGRCSSS